MQRLLDDLGEGKAASECDGCNVVHGRFPVARGTAQPLSQREIEAVRTVFRVCPIARRALGEG